MIDPEYDRLQNMIDSEYEYRYWTITLSRLKLPLFFYKTAEYSNYYFSLHYVIYFLILRVYMKTYLINEGQGLIRNVLPSFLPSFWPPFFTSSFVFRIYFSNNNHITLVSSGKNVSLIMEESGFQTLRFVGISMTFTITS